ncbi:MAG TPA: family 20 glycosylhydrolase [Chitinophagaceae bacterium]|nr:family 20 glycosylhydrolase [Chitinophagaceae bacterium]
MKFFLSLLLFCSATLLRGQQSEIAIIPEPVSIKRTSGVFSLPSNITIEAPASPDLKQTVTLLQQKLSTATGAAVSTATSSSAATVRLQLNKTADKQLGAEGYRLSTTPTGVQISANEPAGLFYGVQTFFQLLPKEIESAAPVDKVKWELPIVEIIDYPRFGWRGLMFDVSRHFFTKEEVKQYIDDMVRYKYNLLHLHLTDDEGWRVEIKSLPRLTEVGAWNVKKVGYFGDFSKPLPNEPRNFGGFYTHDDIRELVQYAKDRFVNILPEIDVPGHSLAAIVAYPELSCTPGADKYVVRSGEQIMDWSRGAPPIALVDNTLCPANEKVYEFMDKVITEVAQLFPFEYIHVGGDETPQNFWKKSAAIKALMQREKLKDMHEVQGYFEKRLEKIVLSKGKKFMGWDEIIEGGLAPTAAVMSWRGMKGGIEAAKQGHEVVMSPTTFAYIDYMQGDPVMEPRVYATLRLNKAYQFEPLPAGVDPKYIKGGQGNLWTEQVYNMRHAQYMTWPRGLALAESVWSPKEKKNWNHFFKRVEKHFQRFDVAEIKYAPSVYEPIITVKKNPSQELSITLASEAEGIDFYYTFDNSFPDRFYPKYTSPLLPPKDAVMLRVVSYKGKEPVGRMLTIPLSELNTRADKKINYPQE